MRGNCEGCQYWDYLDHRCVDKIEFVNKNDGELCCRFHIHAIPKPEQPAAGPWHRIDYARPETLPDTERRVMVIDVISRDIEIARFRITSSVVIYINAGHGWGFDPAYTHWAEIIPPEGK